MNTKDSELDMLAFANVEQFILLKFGSMEDCFKQFKKDVEDEENVEYTHNDFFQHLEMTIKYQDEMEGYYGFRA